MKSMNSLRLSTSTSLQALTVQARRAAAISAVERQLEKVHMAEQKKQAKKQRRLRQSPIELSTRSIRNAIATVAGEGVTVIDEKPGRYSSAHAIISLYSDADIEAQRLAKELHKADASVRVPRLTPIIKYVLYASALDGDRLGSIAIYCGNARTRHAMIAEAGHLFGLPVKSATIESGLSQYIDVVFRA